MPGADAPGFCFAGNMIYAGKMDFGYHNRYREGSQRMGKFLWENMQSE